MPEVRTVPEVPKGGSGNRAFLMYEAPHHKMTHVSDAFDFCPRLGELLRADRAVGETGRVYDNLSPRSSRNTLLTLRNYMLAIARPLNRVQLSAFMRTAESP